MNMIIQLEQKDLKNFRQEHFNKNGGVCPLLKKVVPFEKTVVDHEHKTKSEEAGIDGKGLVRGILEFRGNSFEGKVSNAYKRLGLNKDITLPELLRNLADYLESNLQHEDVKYIHPSEKIKEKTVSKSNYNKLLKCYEKSGKKAKFPEYPKSGKLSKKLKELFEEFRISPYNS